MRQGDAKPLRVLLHDMHPTDAGGRTLSLLDLLEMLRVPDNGVSDELDHAARAEAPRHAIGLPSWVD